jgi:hypothetical protein
MGIVSEINVMLYTKVNFTFPLSCVMQLHLYVLFNL